MWTVKLTYIVSLIQIHNDGSLRWSCGLWNLRLSFRWYRSTPTDHCGGHVDCETYVHCFVDTDPQRRITAVPAVVMWTVKLTYIVSLIQIHTDRSQRWSCRLWNLHTLFRWYRSTPTDHSGGHVDCETYIHCFVDTDPQRQITAVVMWTVKLVTYFDISLIQIDSGGSLHSSCGLWNYSKWTMCHRTSESRSSSQAIDHADVPSQPAYSVLFSIPTKLSTFGPILLVFYFFSGRCTRQVSLKKKKKNLKAFHKTFPQVNKETKRTI